MVFAKIGRNDLCWCGSGAKYKKCHAQFDDILYRYSAKGFEVPSRAIIKTPAQVQGIRESSKLNIALLDMIGQYVVDGVHTAELDKIIHEQTIKLGGIPACLNYNGFPKSVCVSVNEIVCHGIPSEKTILKNGDIVNVDVSTIYNGYFSDSSRMFCVGKVSPEKAKLVAVAKECMELGIRQVKPWGLLGDIGQAVNDYAKQNGCSIVREIGGHGVGLQFHEDPWVSYVAEKSTGMVMTPGMVFTIEPMVNMGSEKITTSKKDGWTVYTADRKPSAQWEKTVLVTEQGCEVLTY